MVDGNEDMGASVPDRATAAEPKVSALRDGIPSADNPVVGWGTLADGSHVPIHADFAQQLWDSAMAAKAKREADMPTEQSAIEQLNDAATRLADFGWKKPCYGPKTGSVDILELGSTGIHDGAYWGEWPNGSWNIYDGDVWPADPAFVRAKAIEARQGGNGEAAQMARERKAKRGKPDA
jgi:hypothetical protein